MQAAAGPDMVTCSRRGRSFALLWAGRLIARGWDASGVLQLHAGQGNKEGRGEGGHIIVVEGEHQFKSDIWPM